MIVLLALIGAITVAVVIYTAMNRGAGLPGQRPAAPRRALAPDDDPDFLRKLGEQQRRDRDED